MGELYFYCIFQHLMDLHSAELVKLKILRYDFTWWQKNVQKGRDEEIFENIMSI